MGIRLINSCLKKIISGSILVLILFVGMISSCRKEHSRDNPVKIEGQIQFEVHAVHHSWDVSHIWIYLKANATEFPGADSTLYDLKGQADGYGKFTFQNLHPGNYYVYAYGYDAIWGSNVIGYNKIVLDQETVINNEARLTLIVSE